MKRCVLLAINLEISSTRSLVRSLFNDTVSISDDVKRTVIFSEFCFSAKYMFTLIYF
jgi:hypothetical protein